MTGDGATTPYTQGVEAFAAWLRSAPSNTDLLRNPHRHDSADAAAWRKGWLAAQGTWEDTAAQEAITRNRR